jgi:hypothetical protein
VESEDDHSPAYGADSSNRWEFYFEGRNGKSEKQIKPKKQNKNK